MFDIIDRKMARLVESRVFGLPAPIAILLAFFAVNLTTCILITGETLYDDREQLVHMQSWAWGYKAAQPALHTWFVKLIDLAVGDDRIAIVVTRYVMLLGTSVLFYTAARLAHFSKAAAAASAMGCLLLPQFAYEGLRMLSHSLTLIFGIALTMNAVLLVVRDGRLFTYALLGLGVAVTILGKYNAVFVIAAVAVGIVSVPEIRHRFRAKRVVFAALLAALLLARPLVWLAANAEAARAGLDLMRMDAAPSFLDARLLGTVSFAYAFLLYATVLIASVAICLGIAHARGFLLAGNAVAAATSEELFLRHTALALVAIAFVLVLASGTTFVKVPWMHPLVILPLVLAPTLTRVCRGDVLNGGVVFAALLAAFSATLAVLIVKLHESGLI